MIRVQVDSPETDHHNYAPSVRALLAAVARLSEDDCLYIMEVCESRARVESRPGVVTAWEAVAGLVKTWGLHQGETAVE